MNPFDELEKSYPDVIAQMPKRFNTHEFILALAYQNQALYIKALAQCVDNQYPFQTAHGMLAKALNKFDDLVHYIGKEPSTNIFGQSNEATVWGKK